VQVTYLGYCSTTGLKAIDYRLTDRYLDPEGFVEGLGQVDEHYSEKSIRLPETYWCYQPGIATPDIAPLPAAENNYITFGSVNNFGKVTPDVLKVWCRILLAVPNSRLFLHTRAGGHRKGITDFFIQQKIDPARVDFVGFMNSVEYFAAYEKIDIALDPFPCAGGTTTCDALWMGVPVITLAGRTSVGRAGISILSNVGITELIAKDPAEYIRIATELSNDLPRLADLRAGLRNRMQNSPLMDGPKFARNVEIAYRQMWREWCG
jgi:predicted O-linked N-acetylglucosamine transferase (SPINDLY family)